MTDILLRFDAGARIGGGHASRCLNLADAMAAVGARCTIATLPDSQTAFPRIMMAGHRICLLGGRNADAELAGRRFEFVVVDHYDLGPDDEARLCRHADRLVIVDDLLRSHPQADVVLDQTLGRDPAAYDGCVPAQARRLTGAGYSLIHAVFGKERAHASARDSKLRRVVVAFGATDPKNATVIALHALELFAAGNPIGTSISADVILGAAAPHRQAVEREIARIAVPVRLHIDPAPENVASLYRMADLAIGAGGVSSWERCCTGVPTLALTLGQDQRAVIDALAACGAVLAAGDIEQLRAETLAALVATLAEPEKRKAMSDAAFAVCDGDGAARAALAILALKSRAPYLRRMTPADAEITYRWQTAPGMRRYFRNPNPPSWEEHVTFVDRALADPAMSLNMIVSADEQPAGILRIDRRSSADSEVSILVAPEWQGRGIAGAVLPYARQLRPRQCLHAYVASDNTASLALFRSAGYRAGERNWLISQPDEPLT